MELSQWSLDLLKLAGRYTAGAVPTKAELSFESCSLTPALSCCYFFSFRIRTSSFAFLDESILAILPALFSVNGPSGTALIRK
jgi:hypothetical protein